MAAFKIFHVQKGWVDKFIEEETVYLVRLLQPVSNRAAKCNLYLGYREGWPRFQLASVQDRLHPRYRFPNFYNCYSAKTKIGVGKCLTDYAQMPGSSPQNMGESEGGVRMNFFDAWDPTGKRSNADRGFT